MKVSCTKEPGPNLQVIRTTSERCIYTRVAQKVRRVSRSHFYWRQGISMAHGLFERPKKSIL